MYIIANYDELYRPANTKGEDFIHTYYVKMPIKPRGKGLRALLKTPKGLETFGIWSLLLQAATETTKPKLRGKLLNHKDESASIEEIAEAISLGRQRGKVKKALEILTELGWVKYVQDAEEVRSDSVQATEEVPPISKGKLSEVESKEKYSQNSEEFRLATLLFSEIQKRKPDFKKPNLQKWTVHTDRMIRLDNRKPTRIAEVICWCQQDAPKGDRGFGWQDNILSTAKLREKFDKLELAMQKESSYSKPVELNAQGLTPLEVFEVELEKGKTNGK